MEPLVNDSPLPAAQESQPAGVAHAKPTQHAASAGSSPGGGTQAPPRWRVQGRAERRQGRGGWAVKKGVTTEDADGTQRRQRRSEQTGRSCGGPQARTAAGAREHTSSYRRPGLGGRGRHRTRGQGREVR